MYLSPRLAKFLINIYGPYLGAGIKVEYISDDWYALRVSMKLRWYNRNAVGVHFGGSLYSMVDPHFMLMHMQLLGRQYIVWDKRAEINFMRPGKGKVTAEFSLTKNDIERVIEKTAGNQIYQPRYEVEIKNEAGNTIARVKKELSIKRKSDRNRSEKRSP